jgi:hypothetical protein
MSSKKVANVRILLVSRVEHCGEHTLSVLPICEDDHRIGIDLNPERNEMKSIHLAGPLVGDWMHREPRGEAQGIGYGRSLRSLFAVLPWNRNHVDGSHSDRALPAQTS